MERSPEPPTFDPEGFDARPAAATPADRGRRRLLIAALVALVALAVSVWIEVRWLRRSPPPPADVSLPAVDDAGDEGGVPAGSPDSSAGVGVSGSGGDGDNTTGMRIGERRTREGLEIPPLSPAPAESELLTTASGSASPAIAPGAATGIVPPQLLRAIRPDYPRIARERRRMATVELKVRVDAAGKVVAAEAVGPPAGLGFDESALQAAMSAQFRPGRRDGAAVEMETRVVIRFVLEGPPR